MREKNARTSIVKNIQSNLDHLIFKRIEGFVLGD